MSSHGTSTSEKAEPNLVPMLDMVLQLVMFFIMVANFTMEQVNKDVMLPIAQSARPGDKRDTDVIYLNLNAEGKLIVPGRTAAQFDRGSRQLPQARVQGRRGSRSRQERPLGTGQDGHHHSRPQGLRFRADLQRPPRSQAGRFQEVAAQGQYRQRRSRQLRTTHHVP